MKNKKLKLVICFLFGLGLVGLQAQESVNVTGNEALGSGGSVAYSIGQVFYNVYTGTSVSVAQGVQQPYEISEITGIHEADDLCFSVQIYPNPTSDYLTLNIRDYVETSLELPQSLYSQLSYQLIDTQGKLLRNEKITGDKTIIVMNNFVPAVYFVKLVQENKEVKIFKIIKN